MCQQVLKWLFVLMLGAVPINVALAKTTGLVVTGIGGNEDYAEQFKAQGEVVVDALRTVSNDPSDFVLLQAEQAPREALLENLEKLASQQSDSFFLVLLGHGTVDSESWLFNLPGEDLTTEDLVAAMAKVDAATQLVLLGTSASGAVLDVLSQPGRYVVTATKSAGEINAVRFPEYLAKAMESAVADIDRNEILTLAEVFRYTNEQTQGYYEEQALLASEHARITGEQPERLALARLGSLREANDDPVVAKLLDERLLLEQEFLALKARKPDMQKAEFYEQLEPLLLSIARLQQTIDATTGWQEVEAVDEDDSSSVLERPDHDHEHDHEHDHDHGMRKLESND